MSDEAPAVSGIAALAIDCHDPPELARWWGRLLGEVLAGRTRGRLLTAGNGGSAAQAQHLTAELVGRYRADRPWALVCTEDRDPPGQVA